MNLVYKMGLTSVFAMFKDESCDNKPDIKKINDQMVFCAE